MSSVFESPNSYINLLTLLLYFLVIKLFFPAVNSVGWVSHNLFYCNIVATSIEKV